MPCFIPLLHTNAFVAFLAFFLQIVVQSSRSRPAVRIPRPTTAFFKGSIAGAPGSSVLMAVQPNGAVHGVAHRGNASFVLARSPRPTAAAAGPTAAAAAMAAAPLSSRRTTSTQTKALPKFKCGVNHAPVPAGRPRPAATPAGGRRLQQVCEQEPVATQLTSCLTVLNVVDGWACLLAEGKLYFVGRSTV